MKTILFEVFDSRPVNQESKQTLLLLLEKQDRNLESQLLQIQKYVQEEIERNREALIALESHTATHGSVSLLHEETALAERKLHQLEDKRHKSLVDKGEAEYTSRLIRGSIDSLRRERLLFDEVHGKKRRELIGIAHAVSMIVNESIDRIESTQKSNAFLKQIKEARMKGEFNWSRAWREQILRMEGFTNGEIDAQRQRCASKKDKVMALLKSGSQQPTTSKHHGSTGMSKSKINSSRDSTSNFDRLYSNDIDSVAKHIGSSNPNHLINIVNEFEALRSSCLLKQQLLNGRSASCVSPSAETEWKEQDDQGKIKVQPVEMYKDQNLSRIVQRMANIARGMSENPLIRSGDLDDGDDIPEEQLLCIVSLLEIWVHKAIQNQGK